MVFRQIDEVGLCEGDRGFSLLLVLISLVVMAVVGTAVLYVSGADHLSARARERAALARQVAEAGLNHFAVLVQPSLVLNQLAGAGAGAGGGGGSGPTSGEFVDILESEAPMVPPTKLRSAPPGFEATYVVWGGAPIDDGAQVIIEGRLHPIDEPEKVVARARISTVVVMTSGSDGYSGTIGWTPRNTGVLGGGEGEGYAAW